MKRYFRNAFLILLAIFALSQLIRPTKNINTAPQPNTIAKLVALNDTVNGILRKACNDCHTNNTEYPWYANITPVNWFLSNHVKDGKKHLNFDEFSTYPTKKMLKKLEEVAEEVEHNAMPMDSYTWMHKDAKLTATEKQILINWAKEAGAIVQSNVK
jgi:hypothetical protein